MHKHLQEKWSRERAELESGLVGWVLKHYYQAGPSEALPIRGDPMPDAPSTQGSTARVVSVTDIGKAGTGSQIFLVVGFETEGWE